MEQNNKYTGVEDIRPNRPFEMEYSRRFNNTNMRIGLIDVDGHSYPNLPLMKISAFHKTKGDSVKWY